LTVEQIAAPYLRIRPPKKLGQKPADAQIQAVMEPYKHPGQRKPFKSFATKRRKKGTLKPEKTITVIPAQAHCCPEYSCEQPSLTG